MRDLPLLGPPVVLLLGTSHMIGEIVMTAEAEAVSLRGCEAICRSSADAVEDIVGVRCVSMAALTSKGSIIC